MLLVFLAYLKTVLDGIAAPFCDDVPLDHLNYRVRLELTREFEVELEDLQAFLGLLWVHALVNVL